MKIILEEFPDLNDVQIERFSKLKNIYSDWNNKINIISRKDIDNIYERHVLHSLVIAKFIKFNKGTTVLDLGTGGGFPVPNRCKKYHQLMHNQLILSLQQYLFPIHSTCQKKSC